MSEINQNDQHLVNQRDVRPYFEAKFRAQMLRGVLHDLNNFVAILQAWIEKDNPPNQERYTVLASKTAQLIQLLNRLFASHGSQTTKLSAFEALTRIEFILQTTAGAMVQIRSNDADQTCFFDSWLIDQIGFFIANELRQIHASDREIQIEVTCGKDQGEFRFSKVVSDSSLFELQEFLRGFHLQMGYSKLDEWTSIRLQPLP